MDKLYFISRNTEPYQLFFDVGIYVPFVRFVCTKVAEHELCTPIVIRAYIVVIDCPRTDRSLVIGIILELATQQAHIKSHFSGYIGRNQHFSLVEVVGLRNVKPQVLPLAATGKRYQASYHFLLLNCRGIREETHVLLRHIKIYHVGCTVIRNLTQEHCQFRYFDVSTKTLFALHRACHVQLIICRFLCEYGCPRIETANPLPLKLLRTQILEHHI